MDGDLRRAPRHPSVSQRSLVSWSGYQSGISVDHLQRDIVGTVAIALRYVAQEGALLIGAQEAGMGVALAGQAHLNQLSIDERGSGFNELPYAQQTPIDLEARRLSEANSSEYADSFLDAQIGAGASLVLTPAHVFEIELARGRAHDLALAQAAIKVWEQRQGWRPPAQRPDDPRRELYASIAVRGRHLAGASRQLAQMYAELAVDGYWLTVFGAGQSAVQLAAITDLALGLQEMTGRPVVVSGVGSMYEALLASGVAATCLGLHGMRPKFPPDKIDSEEIEGVAVQIYHPMILGVVPLGSDYAPALEWLFAAYRCECGHHPATEPPQGRRETVLHNAWSTASVAREATRLYPALDERHLAERVAFARRLRAYLGLGKMHPGWRAVANVARARRSGDDLDSMQQG